MEHQDFIPSALPASAEQKLYLIGYMEKRQAFSQGEFDRAQGKVSFRKEWESLAKSLNGVPNGSRKSTAQWQKFWADQRQAVKARARAANSHNRGTGGGRPANLLSSYDNRVLECMGGWKRVFGIRGVKDPLEINPLGRNTIRSTASRHNSSRSPESRSRRRSRSRSTSRSTESRRRSGSMESRRRSRSRSTESRHRSRLMESRRRRSTSRYPESRRRSRSTDSRRRSRSIESRRRSRSRYTSRYPESRRRSRSTESRRRQTASAARGTVEEASTTAKDNQNCHRRIGGVVCSNAFDYGVGNAGEEKKLCSPGLLHKRTVRVFYL